jgi:hypothetical protein
VLEVEPKLVSAIRFRLAAVADGADRDDLKRTLLSIRRKARDLERDEQAAEGKSGKIKTPDYLLMVVEHADPKSKPWRDLVRVLAASRMLGQIGTIEAVRGLIDIYVRFGEFLRVDTQLQLEHLGDKAIAGLIEARRHPAEKISKWAYRQLDARGKALPSDAVQTTDYSALADILRAYGRVKDPDAARIVVSFANSERAQIRDAARQAIALFGEVGAWQLRDTYEAVVGKKPPRDWTWERTARELFGEFDRLRMAEVAKLFETGNAARLKGDMNAMVAAFDRVLAQSPNFERREELIAGYLDFARKNADDKREAALQAVHRVDRLSIGSPEHNAVQSLLLTLQAETLEAQGIADQTLLRRAIELDPQNSRAKSVLSRLQRGEPKTNEKSRYAAAGAIGLVALLGMGFVLFRRRTPKVAEGKVEAADAPKLDEETKVEQSPS